MAIVVPYNASFVNADKPSMVSDVVVEALFIVGKLFKLPNTYPTLFSFDRIFFDSTQVMENEKKFTLWVTPCEPMD